jgi:UPF0271 protein
MRVDLNADLGEGMGDDAAMLGIVTSANIACGYHAGDHASMRATVALAAARGVGIGAHPSYWDREGFGRRATEMAAGELEALVAHQVGALWAICRLEGARLNHVKPHGALSNRAAVDEVVAEAVAAAVVAVDAGLILLAPAGSVLAAKGSAAGLRVAEEVFADRAYDDAGNLVPRGQPGAVIHDPDQAVAHALAMVRDGYIRSISGALIPCRADSVCVHGDNPQAVAMAQRLRNAFVDAGLSLASLA